MYEGSESVMVGDGSFLPITHTGSTSLATISGNLPLNDVLVCPDIAKPLLSVSKLTKDYPCVFQFDCDDVRVYDKATKKLLTTGRNNNGLYVLGKPPVQAMFSSRQQGASEDIWHRRLGHPNAQVLQLLSASKSISITNKSTKLLCESCQLGKSIRLPFSASSFVASRPLERIHCDLWGPTPIKSVRGFSYYAVLIDNFSRFCWFYPLKYKSDFAHTFKVFQVLVENQYQTKIGTFQCDGGGEFISKQFIEHLQKCGIQQLLSCPYTPQQYGLAERKHRPIVELGLSMMFQSNVPQRFWVEAFYTASFLINLLPTTTLATKCSPYEALNGKSPDYSALRVFGCACYPTLRDYASSKFDPRSLKCVFLGYNEKYKGYRCHLQSTGRVYISRHVIFDETVFPFAQSHSKMQGNKLTPLMTAWYKSQPQTSSSPNQSVQEETLFNDADFPPLPTRRSQTIEEQPATLPVSTVEEERSSGCTEGLDPFPIGNSFSSSSTSSDTSEVQDTAVESLNQDLSAPISSSSEPAVTTQEAQSTHPMITRQKSGIRKPNPRYALLTHKVSYPEPKTVTAALNDEGWTDAMKVEMGNCKEANTWSLVPYTQDMHVLGSKWIFRTKLNADGSLQKLKVRLVAQGYDQAEGIDYLETYSPVVRTATVRGVLHLATIMQWDIKQMDVQNAFLHGDLTETVYMR